MPFVYRRGFKKPKGGRPFEIRASFRREITALNVGLEADVPYIGCGFPETKTRKLLPNDVATVLSAELLFQEKSIL